MNEYRQFKRKIQHRIEILEETIGDLERPRFIEPETACRWRERLATVRETLKDPLLRVAVVGSVKSGKSTLINALSGKDLLKRGPGIITSFITRVLSDGEIGGWVELKSRPQAMDELNSILRVLPAFQEEAGGEAQLDLRRDEDRGRLAALLEKMQAESHRSGTGLDPNFILLKGYLDGYAVLQARLGEDINRLILDEKSLPQHRDYVGHEGLSVYVRDMEIRYPFPWLGDKVEIADCQGSDSPNPVHFELLQQYLLASHFVLYVISSRTGLREADFKLIEFIKTLRMSAQTFFILNADLDVHTGREDLEALAERVRSELAWVVPNPQLHMFSALYHLIDQLGRGVSRKESRMLKLWREDKKLAAVTEAGFSSFKEDFGQRISGRRARVLLGSGLSRLSMVTGSISDAVHARIRFMDDNLADLKSYAGRLKSRHIALQAALGTLANAITGLSDSIRLELSESVDRYFDPDRGRIVRETLDMVDNYPIEEQNLKALTDFRGLLQRLYRFYLEFRQSLSRYLVERVNLRVIEFAKEREAFLEQRLTESYRAFWSLFAAALGDYRREMAELKIELRNAGAPRDGEWPAIEKLALPTFSAFVDREGVGRGVILMKFGIGRVTRFLTGLKAGLGKQNEIFRREAQDEETIREAVELVKAEASTELLRAFREYGGRFKTGYLFRILDRSTLNLLNEFKTRAEMTRLDFENLLKQSDSEGEERKSFMSALKKTGQIAEAMTEELEELRCAVNLEWLHRAEGASPEAKEPAE